MQYTMKVPGVAQRRANPLAWLLLMAVLTLLLLPAYAADAPAGGGPLRNPQLESLQIEIWPEYDRPAALVILRGAIAADAPLPANVTLRIPASSGGPSAMAYSEAAGGNLLNLEYQRTDAKEFITLRVKVPGRFFHVEFYDPLPVGAPERGYSYAWPGDMAVKQLRVVVQEPATASDFSVQPALGAAASGQDGLRYRSAELGAQEAGKQLAIKVRYTKADARTSTAILQPQTPVAAPAASTGSGLSEDVTTGVLLFVLVLSLLIGIGSAVLWWRGRTKPSATADGGAGHCTKCGAPRASGDRYCSKCGARLK